MSLDLIQQGSSPIYVFAFCFFDLSVLLLLVNLFCFIVHSFMFVLYFIVVLFVEKGKARIEICVTKISSLESPGVTLFCVCTFSSCSLSLTVLHVLSLIRGSPLYVLQETPSGCPLEKLPVSTDGCTAEKGGSQINFLFFIR